MNANTRKSVAISGGASVDGQVETLMASKSVHPSIFKPVLRSHDYRSRDWRMAYFLIERCDRVSG